MPKPNAREVFTILKSSVPEFLDDYALRLSAALAFNAIFSIPPLLLIVIRAAGFFFGEQAVTGELYRQSRSLIGSEAAEGIQNILQNAQQNQESSGWAMWVGIGTLIFASTTFFATLQESLNSIWNLKVKPKSGIMRMVKVRAMSFGVVLSISVLLLISLFISTAISLVSDYISNNIPGLGVYVVRLIDLTISLGLITLLFALVFKYIPDAHIAWRDTITGAFITAALFTIGKFLIGLYLGNSNPGSAYGAAGSIIVILVWIYYSSLIVFYGAEVTQQYANRFGRKIVPKEHAVFVEEREVTYNPKDTTSTNTGRPKSEGSFQNKA